MHANGILNVSAAETGSRHLERDVIRDGVRRVDPWYVYHLLRHHPYASWRSSHLGILRRPVQVPTTLRYLGPFNERHLGKFELSSTHPVPRGVPQVSRSFDIKASGILAESML